ncbi:MAG TPA: hypothetical protein PKY81_08730 [bacterium]|nr:hypothetical protein [bacterium]HPN31029.1 hypothetical protein [bacterium]
MFKNVTSINLVILAIIIGGITFIIRRFKRVKKLNYEFDDRVELNDSELSDDQKKVKLRYGSPLEIRRQDSINNVVSFWVYPEKVITFNEDGSLRKKFE